MALRRVIFVVMLCASAASIAAAAAPASTAVSLPQYLSELDSLLAATADLESNPANAAAVADALPSAWSVSTDSKTFEISADPLKSELYVVAKKGDPDHK